MLIQRELYHKEWNDNINMVAETITLLDLIELLRIKGREITSGKIKIGFDNRSSHRRIIQEIMKPSICTQEAGAEIMQIRRIIKEVTFEIDLVLVKGYKSLRGSYNQVLLEHLIKECDIQSKEVRRNI